jgi:hypothetical protein
MFSFADLARSPNFQKMGGEKAMIQLLIELPRIFQPLTRLPAMQGSRNARRPNAR